MFRGARGTRRDRMDVINVNSLIQEVHVELKRARPSSREGLEHLVDGIKGYNIRIRQLFWTTGYARDLVAQYQ